MHTHFSEVGAAGGVGRDLVADAFELSAADVLEVGALRRSGRGFVKIHGNLKALPDLLTHVAGHCHTIFDGDAINRNERDDIGCTHARVRPLVLRQVDEFSGFANAANGGFLDGLAFADQRDHATVVIGVHLAIEQVNAVDLHGFGNGVNLRLVAAFRKIGNAFHQRRHNGQEYKAGREPATACTLRTVLP